MTAAVRERNAPDRRSLAEKNRYEQSFIQCMNLWEDFETVRPLTFHQRIGRAAGELLGVDGLRVWHDQALYKLPGGRATDAHQDHPYWPLEQIDAITAWIPFNDATRESGALAFLPGSHRAGLRRFVNIFSGEPHDILSDPEVAGIEPVHVEVPCGSVSFHHSLTVHFADGNTTDRERAVHTIIYFPDGARRRSQNGHFAVDRAGIEVGQPVASDVTPIAWPRPDGDLPTPPDSSIELPPGLTTNPGSIPRRRP